MKKSIYYVLHTIISALNNDNIFKALREYDELKNIDPETAKEAKNTIMYYLAPLINKYIVIISDLCINKRLCFDGYVVTLAEICKHGKNFVIVRHKYYGAESLQQAYRIAEKLKKQYNAVKVVYDFEQ